tara:strand:- start:71 stop:388 length:318 start_codon:yes stop_codon:yes gene_type:complete
MLNIKENIMRNNLETLIKYQANGDGGYILSQNYDRRLDEVYGNLIFDYPHICQRSTHKEQKNRLFKALANSYKVKFADVKRLGDCVQAVREEEFVIAYQMKKEVQ